MLGAAGNAITQKITYGKIVSPERIIVVGAINAFTNALSFVGFSMAEVIDGTIFISRLNDAVAPSIIGVGFAVFLGTSFPYIGSGQLADES